jgi:hypothetical protein
MGGGEAFVGGYDCGLLCDLLSRGRMDRGCAKGAKPAPRSAAPAVHLMVLRSVEVQCLQWR